MPTAQSTLTQDAVMERQFEAYPLIVARVAERGLGRLDAMVALSREVVAEMRTDVVVRAGARLSIDPHVDATPGNWPGPGGSI